MIVLKTENLKKYYGEDESRVKALDGIDIAIEKGEFSAIMGSSGSGKSTLLHMLGGLDEPTSGKVLVDNIDLASLTKDEKAIFRRKNIGSVCQKIRTARQIVRRTTAKSRHGPGTGN